MRHRISVVHLLAAVCVTGLALTAAAGTIVGSAHDFTPTGLNGQVGGVTEICAPCHVPHHTKLNVPLWSHTLTGQTFNLYNTNPNYIGPNSTSYGAAIDGTTQTMSRACLGCHDGTLAVAGTSKILSADDCYIPWNNGAPDATADTNSLLGNHPIGVTYNPAVLLPAGEFAAVANLTANGVVLENSKVQCVSCHNAHNRNASMLVKDNTGSALCLVCHVK